MFRPPGLDDVTRERLENGLPLKLILDDFKSMRDEALNASSRSLARLRKNR